MRALDQVEVVRAAGVRNVALAQREMTTLMADFVCDLAGAAHAAEREAAVGIGETLEEAEQIAEEAVLRVVGEVRHRSDIGTRQMVSRRVEHMAELRGLPISAERLG